MPWVNGRWEGTPYDPFAPETGEFATQRGWSRPSIPTGLPSTNVAPVRQPESSDRSRRGRGDKKKASPAVQLPAPVSAPIAPVPGGSAPSSLAGLNTAASNVSGGSGAFTPGEGGEAYGPGVQLSAPGALRQGLGTRILPQQSMSLAALRRIY